MPGACSFRWICRVSGRLALGFALICSGRCDAREPASLAEAAAQLVGGAPRRILIIGDSLTDFSRGFELGARLGVGWQVAYRGRINSDFLTWTGRLDEAFDEARNGPPEIIFAPLGTNDAFLYGPELTLAHLDRFHQDLRTRSNARVYYFLMPPTLIESLAPALRRNNAALRARGAPEGTPLIDLEALFEREPLFPPLYAGDDPLHPTESGYRIISIELERVLLAGAAVE